MLHRHVGQVGDPDRAHVRGVLNRPRSVGTASFRAGAELAASLPASSPLVQVGNRGYGYLWWREDIPYGDGTLATFSALGAGGQVLTVVPDLDLVILHLGGSYSSAGWRYAQAELIPNAILPAVR